MSEVIHVFVGPSLPRTCRPNAPGLVYHAPAAQGDLYGLVATRPFAIGLIDGYFERVPAVWHKEVLWALSEGVHVWGAASMGALRAAELADFGMVGVGSVFEKFASGELNDDDEVTIVHADADNGFRPGSEAMVNIRATLEAAERAGVLSSEEKQQLVDVAKSAFYPDRNYASLILAAKATLPEARGAAFERWVRTPEHRTDIKRLDALALIERLLALRTERPGLKRVSWTFNHTDAWETVRRSFLSNMNSDAEPLLSPPESLPRESPADELLRLRAELRAAWAELARRDGFVPSPDELIHQARQFSERKGLTSGAQLRAWMQSRNITESELERLLKDEACAKSAAKVRAKRAESSVADYLCVRPD